MSKKLASAVQQPEISPEAQLEIGVIFQRLNELIHDDSYLSSVSVERLLVATQIWLTRTNTAYQDKIGKKTFDN